MKSMKLNVAKSLVVIALVCPVAFADGDQGSGGFANTEVQTVKTSQTSLDGDQGSGGRSVVESILTSIYGYLDSMI